MTFRKFLTTLLLLFIVQQNNLAKKPVYVLTTIPELSWAIKQIAPKNFKIEALLKPGVNAHYVDAKPSFIMKLKKADLVCSIGLGLEGAWLNRSIQRSFNEKITSNKSGHCLTGKKVKVLGSLKVSLDRSHGHLHADGNPHYWYSPSKIVEVLPYLESKINFFIKDDILAQNNLKIKVQTLTKKLNETEKYWKTQFSQKKYNTITQYHSDFDYYIASLGLNNVASLESKPGVPPSAEHLNKILKITKEQKVKVILAHPWDPLKVINSLAKKIGAKSVIWPHKEKDYIKAYTAFSQQILDSME